MLTIVIIIITYRTRYFNQLLSCTHFIISSSLHLCFIFPLPSLSPPSLRLPYPLPLPLPPFPLPLPLPCPSLPPPSPSSPFHLLLSPSLPPLPSLSPFLTLSLPQHRCSPASHVTGTHCMIKRRNKCKGKTKAVRRPTYLFTFQLRMDAYRNTTTAFL